MVVILPHRKICTRVVFLLKWSSNTWTSVLFFIWRLTDWHRKISTFYFPGVTANKSTNDQTWLTVTFCCTTATFCNSVSEPYTYTSLTTAHATAIFTTNHCSPTTCTPVLLLHITMQPLVCPSMPFAAHLSASPSSTTTSCYTISFDCWHAPQLSRSSIFRVHWSTNQQINLYKFGFDHHIYSPCHRQSSTLHNCYLVNLILDLLPALMPLLGMEIHHSELTMPQGQWRDKHARWTNTTKIKNMIYMDRLTLDFNKVHATTLKLQSSNFSWGLRVIFFIF